MLVHFCLPIVVARLVYLSHNHAPTRHCDPGTCTDLRRSRGRTSLWESPWFPPFALQAVCPSPPSTHAAHAIAGKKNGRERGNVKLQLKPVPVLGAILPVFRTTTTCTHGAWYLLRAVEFVQQGGTSCANLSLPPQPGRTEMSHPYPPYQLRTTRDFDLQEMSPATRFLQVVLKTAMVNGAPEIMTRSWALAAARSRTTGRCMAIKRHSFSTINMIAGTRESRKTRRS